VIDPAPVSPLIRPAREVESNVESGLLAADDVEVTKAAVSRLRTGTCAGTECGELELELAADLGEVDVRGRSQ
jgi:hypothetical protein